MIESKNKFFNKEYFIYMLCILFESLIIGQILWFTIKLISLWEAILFILMGPFVFPVTLFSSLLGGGLVLYILSGVTVVFSLLLLPWIILKIKLIIGRVLFVILWALVPFISAIVICFVQGGCS